MSTDPNIVDILDNTVLENAPEQRGEPIITIPTIKITADDLREINNINYQISLIDSELQQLYGTSSNKLCVPVDRSRAMQRYNYSDLVHHLDMLGCSLIIEHLKKNKQQFIDRLLHHYGYQYCQWTDTKPGGNSLASLPGNGTGEDLLTTSGGTVMRSDFADLGADHIAKAVEQLVNKKLDELENKCTWNANVFPGDSDF